MNRHLLLAGAAALSLALAACGPKTEQTEAVAPDANPAATVPTPSNEAAAPDFVAKAAASDMFEVEAGKIALSRSTNADVKAFAQMMVDGHTKTTADLTAAITKSGLMITPPATLPDDKASALSDLKAVEAKDFDKAYMDGQVDAHQAALDLMSRYSQDGDNADIKAAATATVPIVQEHLDKAKAIRDALK
jgi:putative membrane protein